MKNEHMYEYASGETLSLRDFKKLVTQLASRHIAKGLDAQDGTLEYGQEQKFKRSMRFLAADISEAADRLDLCTCEWPSDDS